MELGFAIPAKTKDELERQPYEVLWLIGNQGPLISESDKKFSGELKSLHEKGKGHAAPEYNVMAARLIGRIRDARKRKGLPPRTEPPPDPRRSQAHKLWNELLEDKEKVKKAFELSRKPSKDKGKGDICQDKGKADISQGKGEDGKSKTVGI